MDRDYRTGAHGQSDSEPPASASPRPPAHWDPPAAEPSETNAHVLHALGYELARRSHRVSLITAAFVLAYTTITAIQAFLLYQSYRESQRAFVASERPYVSLGDRDGRIAEFRTDRSGRTALVVYFYNAGHTPALNFIANIWTSKPGAARAPERHIERVENPATGVVETVPGPAIPGQATRLEYAPGQLTPSSDEISLIRAGKEFSVGGTFEYCDEFGDYRCQGFWARYQPPPIDGFVQFAAPPCWLPPESGHQANSAEKSAVKVLKRCEQPHRSAETTE
jgi:hypothetical protein